MIRAVIFDFYGVICNDIGAQWYKTRPPQEIVPELKTKYDALSDSGQVSEVELFEALGTAVNTTGEAVRKEWLDLVKIDTVLVDFIRTLRATHKVAVCSNTAPQIFRDILREQRLEELFNVIVSSSEVAMVKPNPDIFLHTLAQLGVTAEEAIFTDDRTINVEAAQRLGIRSFVYSNPATLRRNLDGLV